MSVLNPWAEAKQLREKAAKLESELHIERTVNNVLRGKMANMHSRDPKTGRILPKGK